MKIAKPSRSNIHRIASSSVAYNVCLWLSLFWLHPPVPKILEKRLKTAKMLYNMYIYRRFLRRAVAVAVVVSMWAGYTLKRYKNDWYRDAACLKGRQNINLRIPLVLQHTLAVIFLCAAFFSSLLPLAIPFFRHDKYMVNNCSHIKQTLFIKAKIHTYIRKLREFIVIHVCTSLSGTLELFLLWAMEMEGLVLCTVRLYWWFSLTDKPY